MKKAAIGRDIEVFAPMMKQVASIFQSDLSQNILSIKDFIAVPQAMEAASAHAVSRFIAKTFVSVQVLNKLGHLILMDCDKQGIDRPIVPYTSKFFGWMGVGRQYHLRKKRWP